LIIPHTEFFSIYCIVWWVLICFIIFLLYSLKCIITQSYIGMQIACRCDRSSEFKRFIEKQYPDTIFFQETHLKPDKDFRLKWYNVRYKEVGFWHSRTKFHKEKARRGWLFGFVNRNPELPLRMPEPTSFARAIGFDKPSVDKFFNWYKTLVGGNP